MKKITKIKNEEEKKILIRRKCIYCILVVCDKFVISCEIARFDKKPK